tara:strand:+ start:228 stop:548 length:321 start_codon:yes stop_codon:yes gene_type:complete
MAIKTIEEFRVEATSEIEARKPMKAQVNNDIREFTDAEYDQAIEDLAQSKLDEQDNGYKKSRQQSYPAIPEQLDMLFWAIDAGKVDKTSDFYKTLKKVKDDNPKPE